MRSVATALVLSFLAIPFSSLTAQQPPPVQPGARVRVTAPGVTTSQLVGTHAGFRGGILELEPDSAATTLDIPLASLVGLEVSRGRKSNVAEYARWCGVVGAGLGATVFLVDGQPVIRGAFVLGLTSLLLGSTAGVLTKTELWQDVPLDRLPGLLVAPQDGHVSLGLSLSF